jgi:hypothetical protein
VPEEGGEGELKPLAALLIGIVALGARAAVAQQEATSPEVAVDPTVAVEPSIEPPPDPGDGASRGAAGGVTPLVAPLPFRNSQIGWGVAVMAGLIHRFDADTTLKPSTGAITALVSENGSWGVMGLEIARFGGDAWRARGMVGYMDLKYDFFGIGIDAGEAGDSIPIEQTIYVASGGVLRRVVPGLYIGPTLVWMQATVSPDDEAGPQGAAEVPDQAEAHLVAPGLLAEYDTRNSDYWPDHGSLAQLKANFFSTTSGESGSFQRYQAVWSWYHGLRGHRLVLVTNVNGCGAPGDAPFYGLCSLGSGRFALRGYTQGRYRDHYATVVQAELRAHTAGRLGAAIFGGFAGVAPEFSDLFDARMLPAGGAGLRYQLTRNYPMHLRLDYAWGNDGGLLYFSVGEAF